MTLTDPERQPNHAKTETLLSLLTIGLIVGQGTRRFVEELVRLPLPQTREGLTTTKPPAPLSEESTHQEQNNYPEV